MKALTAVDLELTAMSRIVRAFRHVDDDGCRRVLRWAEDKFIVVPGRQVDAMVDGLRSLRRR